METAVAVETDLQTRLMRLRQHLASASPAREAKSAAPALLSAAGGDGLPRSLEHRLAALAGQLERSQSEALKLAQQRREAPTALDGAFEGLVGRAARLAQRLHRDAACVRQTRAQLDPLPLDNTLGMGLHQAHALAETALRLLSEARLSATRQLEMLPALEAMATHLHHTVNVGLSKARGALQRRELVQAVMRLHEQTLAGTPPTAQLLADLAERVRADLNRTVYPAWQEGTDDSPAARLAERAVHVAVHLAFVAQRQPRWQKQLDGLLGVALLHDVGMLQLPGLMASKEPLAEAGRAALKAHPRLASTVLERLEGFGPPWAQAAAQHHERLDGSGYPAGLKGEQVSEPACLLAAVDSYIARRSRRPDRPALSAHDALTECLRASETGLLDPTCVCALLDLSFFPVGSVVELATGEIAEVVAPQLAAAHPEWAALPFVRLLTEGRCGRATTVVVNLADHPECRIVRELSAKEAARHRDGLD